MNQIICGDAIEVLKTLPSNYINCCVTSPPYFNQRIYFGGDKEIGREKTIRDYISNLGDVFDQVKRVLTDDGTCWVVINDTYSGGGGYSKDSPSNKDSKQSTSHSIPKFRNSQIPAKSLMLIPQRFAIEMSDRGWILRNTIIWHKRSCMPASVKDRFTVDYEYVFFFVKSKKYYFQQLFEPYKTESIEQLGRAVSYDHKNMRVPGQTTHGLHKARARGQDTVHFDPRGRNMRCIWEINSKPFKGAHFATFPEKLVERCLSAGCPAGGMVLDPFSGTATTGVVADKLHMNYVGIELNSDYVKMSQERLSKS